MTTQSIREALEKISPWPWKECEEGYILSTDSSVTAYLDASSQSDASFIASAPEMIAFLLERVEELKKERASPRSCKHPESFHLTITQETLDARLRIERREEREEIVAMLEGMKIPDHLRGRHGTVLNQALADAIEAIRGRG